MESVSVNVKCIKFGDSSSIVYKDEGKNIDSRLIVDCGSANVGNGLRSKEFAFSKIEGELLDDTNDSLLITHYHKDHYNGILKMIEDNRLKKPHEKRYFKKIYLPYTIFEDKTIFSTTMSRFFVLGSKNSGGKIMTDAIFKLILNLSELVVNPLEDIRMLKRSDRFYLDDSRCDKNLENIVLWPEVLDRSTVIDGVETGKDFKVEDIDNINKDLLQLIFEETDLEKLMHEDKFIYGDESIYEEFNAVVGKLSNSINDIFNIYSGADYNDDNFQKNTEEYQGRIQELNGNIIEATNLREKIWGYIDNDELGLRYKIKRWQLKEYHKLIDCMNSLGVVFHSEEYKYIFMADITSKVIDHLKPDYRDDYKLVKVPHHGTRKHYSDEIPLGSNLVISNGGYGNRPVHSEWGYKKAEVICTDAHVDRSYCLYKSGNSGLCSGKCTGANDYHEIIIK